MLVEPVAKMLRLPRKNNLSCFKSLLVTGLWDITLTSLLPPNQSCFSKFWAWSSIVSNFSKGWRGDHKHKIMDRPRIPLDYFIEKITTIREELQGKRGTTNHAQVELLYSCSEFNHFKSVSYDELSDLVPRSTLKSCVLDPIPASVLKNCYGLLLPYVYHEGCELFFAELHVDFRHETSHCQALSQETITWLPTIQESQTYLQPDVSLQVLREGSQFISQLRENKLEEIFQSAYKVGHSTEPALLQVHNDVLCALDDGRCVMLVLLDLSAACDTVDHGILLSRLSQCIGVQGSAYTWFESYLSSRSQFVQIRDTSSSDRQLTCGVPQGSVLGPILFGAILRRHGVGFHMYADDTQLYLSMKTTKVEDVVSARTGVEVCLRELNQWMLLNNLRLNNDTTELLVLHCTLSP